MKNVVLGSMFLFALCSLPVLAVAEEMPAAEPIASEVVVADGKKVTFEYTLKVDGQEIDSNVGKEPIIYTQGDNTIIPGLSSQMAGLKAGDQKSVTVEAKDGYGEEDPNAIQEVAKAEMPKDVIPEVGMVLELQGDDGRSVPGVISEVTEDKVKINFNHPLAGKKLDFDIKVLKVE